MIGRAADAAIQLSGDRVSRRHATITSSGRGLILRDEGARNRLRCNGHQHVEFRLADNDVVRIGDWVGVIVESVENDASTGSPFEVRPDGVVVGPRTRELWRTIERLAVGDLCVVIEGETGTGKEVVAAALHRASGRRGRFVAVNCAALPPDLFEASLFGHTRGAFTGAIRASDGYFVSADRGTLFLDELVELSLAQQAKILRAVEERRVTPLGAVQAREVDVRIVSAAQRPLALLVGEGCFRSDLMARLNGFTVQLLPLRGRREEIVRLFRHAMESGGDHVSRLSAGAAERLCTHPWHQNVRELFVVARRCRVLHPETSELSARHVDVLLQSGR